MCFEVLTQSPLTLAFKIPFFKFSPQPFYQSIDQESETKDFGPANCTRHEHELNLWPEHSACGQINTSRVGKVSFSMTGDRYREKMIFLSCIFAAFLDRTGELLPIGNMFLAIKIKFTTAAVGL